MDEFRRMLSEREAEMVFLTPRTSAAVRSQMPDRSFGWSTFVGPPFLYTPAPGMFSLDLRTMSVVLSEAAALLACSVASGTPGAEP